MDAGEAMAILDSPVPEPWPPEATTAGGTAPAVDGWAESRHLARVPQEVLLRISSFLATPQLGSLRLTSRAIDQKLFNSFAREFFYKKQFMITESSLKTLIDLSQHPTLKSTLNTLVIGLDRYNFMHHGRFSTTERELAYRTGAAEQTRFLSSGRALKMLTEALGNLKGLQTIDIRDFNSRTRFRDGPSAQWNSYGANTIFQATGSRLSLSYSPLGNDFLNQVFTLVLDACAASQARPPSLEIVLKHRSWGIGDAAFMIPHYLQPGILPVLSGLKRLHLDVDLNNGQINAMDPSTVQFPAINSAMLRTFLTFTANLTYLRLNFQATGHYAADAFMQWLALPATAEGAISLPHLRDLEFGSLEVGATVLRSVLMKFLPELTHISLWKVGIFDTGDDRINHFSLLFKHLARLGDRLALTRFLVGRLYHKGLPTTPVYQVAFKTPHAQPGLMAPSRQYPGRRFTPDEHHPTIAEFLAQLAADTVVQWPPPVEATGSDDEDSNVGTDLDG